MTRSSPQTYIKDRLTFRDAAVVLLLWALIGVCYWRIALAGRVLAGGDAFTYFYPYWAEATRAFQSGRLPLWNPYLFMGAPFLANSQVGVFYPLNWPLWLLLPAHRALHLSIVGHLCLAALGTYLWARRTLRLGYLGAGTAGLVFTLGGYLGAQIEHVNQIQGLAWLPWLLWLWDVAQSRQRGHAWARVGLVLAIGLLLLAGHTQTAFIALCGLTLVALGPALWRAVRRGAWRDLAGRVGLLAAVCLVGGLLAAVQLAPTWELSRFSVRAAGLPFRERVSFSLTPFYFTRALLPGFSEVVIPEHIEHVAYVGVAGLALALAGVLAARRAPNADRPGPRVALYVLIVTGLFLSLGAYNPLYWLLARFVPGFAHFRVPARFLALYALGLSGLAGWGVTALKQRCVTLGWRALLAFGVLLAALAGWAVLGVRLGEGGRVGWITVAAWILATGLAGALLWLANRAPRWAVSGLLALLLAELLVAGTVLPHSQATAAQAFTDIRPAVAHLLAAQGGEPNPGADRFISMSDILFDPGDLPELEHIYAPQISEQALYQLVIATKIKEVLSPNMPLLFGVPAVDGFDGGILPLTHYITLQRLFLAEDQVSIDGRLRENLTAIPDPRWLTLFDVRHVITDKTRDAWLDGVFYDLQFTTRLAQGEQAQVAYVPPFQATAVGIVSYLEGGAALPAGTPVGAVELTFSDGLTQTLTLRAGEHTAEGLYTDEVVHPQATVGGHFWPGQPEGNDYVARLVWEPPAEPLSITVRGLTPQGDLVIRGVSLIDERTGSFQALVLSGQGRFRLVHSGDVKIYENLSAAGRAFLIHQAVVLPDDDSVLAHMQAAMFDPLREVVLSGAGDADWPQPAAGEEHVQVVGYSPERVTLMVTATTPGYVLLADAWYPGWQAEVDGQPVPLYRADLLFRAVALDAGQHEVVFLFRPLSVRVGAWISLAGGLGLIGLWLWSRLFCPKRDAVL